MGARKTHNVGTKSETSTSRDKISFSGSFYLIFHSASLLFSLPFDVVKRIRKLFSFPNTRRDGKRAKGEKAEYFWISRAKEVFFCIFFIIVHIVISDISCLISFTSIRYVYGRGNIKASVDNFFALLAPHGWLCCARRLYVYRESLLFTCLFYRVSQSRSISDA